MAMAVDVVIELLRAAASSRTTEDRSTELPSLGSVHCTFVPLAVHETEVTALLAVPGVVPRDPGGCDPDGTVFAVPDDWDVPVDVDEEHALATTRAAIATTTPAVRRAPPRHLTTARLLVIGPVRAQVAAS
jgi:hypothetical protein